MTVGDSGCRGCYAGSRRSAPPASLLVGTPGRLPGHAFSSAQGRKGGLRRWGLGSRCHVVGGGRLIGAAIARSSGLRAAPAWQLPSDRFARHVDRGHTFSRTGRADGWAHRRSVRAPRAWAARLRRARNKTAHLTRNEGFSISFGSSRSATARGEELVRTRQGRAYRRSATGPRGRSAGHLRLQVQG